MPNRFIHIPTIVLATWLLSGCDMEPQMSGESAAPASPAQTASEAMSAADDTRETEPGRTAAAPKSEPAKGEGVNEIEWDALIPDDYRPDKLMAEFDIDALSDDDPRAAELMAKLKALWDEAPVREELDGNAVKLPGFVVPVEGDDKETTGFLLVPYYGACIHVPPPPANQTVYVVTEKGKGAPPGLFDVVWVTGTMSVQRISNDIAEAGYTLYASEVAPYE
jgi:uncharacterized protein